MNRTKWWRQVASVVGLAVAMTAIASATSLQGAEAQRHARPAAAASASNDDPPAASADGFVNINSASETELARLPGIGASKAQAIVAYRQRAGRFSRVEDVMRVRGIGRATFRRLRPMLRLDGPTTLGAGGGAGGNASHH